MAKAKDYGLDNTSALNVYNNAASNNEDLEAATTDLKTKIREYEIEHATYDKPVDLSDLLENYKFEDNFEAGSSDNLSWTQAPANSFPPGADNLNNTNTNLGRWAFDDTGFTDAKIYQSLVDVPNGKYELKVDYICIDQNPSNPESDGKDPEDYSVTGNTLYAITSLGTSSVNLSSGSRWGSASTSITFFVTDGKLEFVVFLLFFFFFFSSPFLLLLFF